MELRCVVCGGLISGAVHVEPEGYYHPECFYKTDKGQRVKFMSEVADYAFRVFVDILISQVIVKVKARFADQIKAYGLSDDDLITLIRSRFGLV